MDVVYPKLKTHEWFFGPSIDRRVWQAASARVDESLMVLR
jgi:hypothetical protein